MKSIVLNTYMILNEYFKIMRNRTEDPLTIEVFAEKVPKHNHSFPCLVFRLESGERPSFAFQERPSESTILSMRIYSKDLTGVEVWTLTDWLWRNLNSEGISGGSLRLVLMRDGFEREDTDDELVVRQDYKMTIVHEYGSEKPIGTSETVVNLG